MRKVAKYALTIPLLMLSIGTVFAVDSFFKKFEAMIGGILIVTDTVKVIDPDFSVAVADATATGTSPTSPVYFPDASGETAFATTPVAAGDWIFSATLMPTSNTPLNTLFKVEFTPRVPDPQNPGNPVGGIVPKYIPVPFYIATCATATCPSPDGDIVVVWSIGSGPVSLGEGPTELPTPISWTLTVEKVGTIVGPPE